MTTDEQVVDVAALHRLASDVGTDAACDMVDRFLDLLEARLLRIRRAPDAEELGVAVLSLACSASMLGAEALAASARSVRLADLAPGEITLPDGEKRDGAEALQRLEHVARRSAGELSRLPACSS
ncbi:hypothetical protein ACPYO6_13585 [Georgenia sp. Z1344]|uniref:hypothetical protein n=1 Tax=Georgenia sp. Z1344 TaxID=3416706 RepID=UPI003CED06C7